MSNNINFGIDDVRFQFRIAGICLDNDLVLLNQIEGDDIWYLPGGRCQINENSYDAINREFMEEMGCAVNVLRPLWFVEYFYKLKSNEKRVHELMMLYLIDVPDEKKGLNEFYGQEDDKKIIYRWFKVSELNSVIVYPVFLKEKLKKLPENFETFVFQDGV